MTVTADALGMLAGDPPRTRLPGDFHRHPTTGAPYVAHPTETNKDGTPCRVMYGRPSSFGSALDNPYNLIRWKERQLVVGISRLSDWSPWLDPDDRDTLDALVAYAYDAAETHLAADRGTHVHSLLQWTDEHPRPAMMSPDLLMQGDLLGIPIDLQMQIDSQWVAFRRRLGLTALAVEQTVVNDRWRLAGTLDRLDVADHDILTSFGVIDAGVPFVGDIKTGSLTLGNDGQPNYWVKYPVQLAAYVDAVPYDTDTDERAPLVGDGAVRPHAGIALIYHYDLVRAMAGEVVDWQAIPVNVQAGREGGDLCRAAADFAKRRDLFAMPASVAAPAPAPNRAVEQPAQTPEPIGLVPVPGSAATPDKLRARIAGLVAAYPDAADKLRTWWPADTPTLKHDGHTVDQLDGILRAVRLVEANVGAPWHPDDGAAPHVNTDPHAEVAYPVVVDEGGPVDRVLVDGLAVQLDRLGPVARDLCRQIAREAHDAGRSISVSANPTVRRWSIACAVIAWAASGRSVDELWLHAGLIATHAQCCDADATLGGLLSQFSIAQADRLYEGAGT